MSASYWIGNILGVILIPLVADRLGRRIAIAIGSCLCIVGAAICTATVNHGAFIAGRILLGMGGVMCSSVSTVLMTELAYPSHRATATALSSTTYSVGAILAAWVAFGSFRISDSWYVFARRGSFPREGRKSCALTDSSSPSLGRGERRH